MTVHPPAPDDDEQSHLSNDSPSSSSENEIEGIHLLMQDQQPGELVGSILPEELDLSHVHRVLDVASGSGSWVLDMARSHPTTQVIGLNKNSDLIEQARMLTKEVPNATFLVQDMRHLAESTFAPETFDLITIRCIAGEVSPQELRLLLQACQRLCRPGGLLHWVEAELPVTNSLVFEQLIVILLRGLKTAGRIFSPGGNSLGITPVMRRWLEDAGCRLMLNIAHAIDLSAGTSAHNMFLRQVDTFGQQVRPFLLATGATTGAEFEELFQRVQSEISASTFCGICFLRTVVGVRRL